MKRNKFLCLALLLPFALTVVGQDKIGLDISMQYYYNHDNTVSLRAEVYDEEEYESVTDLEFEFYSIGANSEVLLGTAFSNEEAIVEIVNIPFEQIILDSAGKMAFRLNGQNDTYSGEYILKIKHATLEMNFDIVDSVKILSVKLITKNEEGEPVGIEDGEIYFSVPRLFSQLPIGDVWTDENGYDEMKFPVDLPGDVSGNLVVIAKLTGHEEFGNLEKRSETDWGVPISMNAELPRALWSGRPPMWMIITFSFLMIAVFGHYLWVMLNLVRIKKLGE